jgi:iron complex outermembrane receptor protein
MPGNVDLTATVRAVDALRNPDVPRYAELDLRLAWRPSPNWEFSVFGQNLLHPQHLEFMPSAFRPTQASEIQRAVYAQVTFRY